MGTGPVFLIGQQSCCNSRLVAAPALVDALTGAIYEVGPGAIGKTRDDKTSYALPIYDSPLLLMDGSLATGKGKE